MRRKFRGFSLTRGIPTDASSAYGPGSRANNRIFPGESSSYNPPSLKGYTQLRYPLDKIPPFTNIEIIPEQVFIIYLSVPMAQFEGRNKNS